jgi:hypothetical protein
MQGGLAPKNNTKSTILHHKKFNNYQFHVDTASWQDL